MMTWPARTCVRAPGPGVRDNWRMRGVAIVALVSGCSFFAVKGPTQHTELITDPSAVTCTDSDLVPSLDGIGGALAIAAAGGGVILQHTRDDGTPKHFDLYFAPALLAAAIVYWSSASYGTNRVEQRYLLRRADDHRPGER